MIVRCPNAEAASVGVAPKSALVSNRIRFHPYWQNLAVRIWCARFAPMFDQISCYKVQGCFCDRRGADRFFLNEFVHRLWRPVEHHATMALTDESPRHVSPHPLKSDHVYLHNSL